MKNNIALAADLVSNTKTNNITEEESKSLMIMAVKGVVDGNFD